VNLEQDITVMLLDLGSTIAAGGKQTRGMVDSADEALMQSGTPSPFIGRSIVVTIRTGSIPVTEGSALTIDGKPYLVREKYQLDDGLLTRILCAKA
jgi:hypothetical protein